MAYSDESELVKEFLKSPTKEDAMQWLARGGDGYGIGSFSQKESIGIVETLFELGAVEVYVVETQINGDLGSTDSMLLRLPRDRFKRSEIFAWNNDRVGAMGADPDEDRGQEWLYLWFD